MKERKAKTSQWMAAPEAAQMAVLSGKSIPSPIP